LASIGSNVNILDTSDESVAALAELAVKVRGQLMGPEGVALVRLTVEYDSLDDAYEQIDEAIHRYDQLLSSRGFDAYLALENTRHSIEEWRRIADVFSKTRNIGWTFDPGNFATKELHPEGGLPNQGAIMQLAADYADRIYSVHLKQVFQGHALSIIEESIGRGYAFHIGRLINTLRGHLSYQGSIHLEPTASSDAQYNLNISIHNLPILHD